MKLKLIANKVKSRRPSVKKNAKRNNKPLLMLFAAGLFVFLAALGLYMFQNKIPHLTPSPGDILSPDDAGQNNANFRKTLQDNGIAFDSVASATESPTLIVKLTDGTFVYLDSSKDPTPALEVLKSILSRLSIQDSNKIPKYIDLRSEKAVIKF